VTKGHRREAIAKHLSTALVSATIFALGVSASDPFCKGPVARIPFHGLDRADAFWVLPVFVFVFLHAPIFDLVSFAAFKAGWIHRLEYLAIMARDGRPVSRAQKMLFYPVSLAIAFGALSGWIRLSQCS